MSKSSHSYIQLCYTKKSIYERMLKRGDKHSDIAFCIYMQLKELQPHCSRYKQIFFWAEENIDRAELKKYGFGITSSIPRPIIM